MRSFVVKKQKLTLFTVAVAMASAAIAQTAPATAAAPAGGHVPNKVGVIQVQSALVSTKDGQKAMQEFQAKLEPRKKDLERKAGEIRELQDKLQRGGAAMAEAAKMDLTRTIDAKTKSYNRDMQDAQDEADQEQRKLLDDLSGKMTQVIDKYAQANGYSVILNVSDQNTPVIYASNQVEITKDIIEMYDKMNPSSGPTAPATPAAKPPAPKPTAPPATPAPVKKQPQ
jgi:outer membrane protein